jgi:tetratricopeptide (TPR) repeat protein
MWSASVGDAPVDLGLSTLQLSGRLFTDPLRTYAGRTDSVCMMSARSAHSRRDPARNRIVAAFAALMLIALVGSFFLVLKGYVGGPAQSHANGADPVREPGPHAATRSTTEPRTRRAEPGADLAQRLTQAKERAAALQREGRFAEAGTVLEAEVSAAPFDRDVRLSLAQAYIGQQRFADAYKCYEAALAIVAERTQHQSEQIQAETQPASTSLGSGSPPSDTTAAKRAVTREEAELHFQAGVIASKLGNVEKAEEHFVMAQTGDPREARYPLYAAMTQIRAGKDSAAVASLVRATKLNPDLAEAWGTLAELSLKDNSLGLAGQHLERARKLQPDVVRWKVVEARILNRDGKPEAAATLLLALNPAQRREKPVMALLAESYGLLERPSEAARMYRVASDAVDTDADLAILAAEWLEKAGDTASAMTYARRASALGDTRGDDMLSRLRG